MSKLVRAVTTAALCLMPFAVSACGSADTDPRTLPPLVKIVEAGSATRAIREFSGVIGARVQSDLGFRVGGKIVARLVDNGQRVRRGQPLLRIDATDYALATQAAGASVESARALAEQTAADERRYRDLVAAGAVSASAYDQVKAAALSARADLVAAEAQARLTRNSTSYTVLVADADGTVVETLAEPGQVVAAGQTVIRIARSGPREAILSLPEDLRPMIGSVAQARTYGGLTGQARLRQLSDAADPTTRTYEARYVLSGPAASAPLGATVAVNLALPDQRAVISVPLAAVADRGGGPGVWTISGRQQPKVTWRPVTLAGIGDETATVAAGLRGGERIVALGAHLLHPNQAVRIQGADQ